MPTPKEMFAPDHGLLIETVYGSTIAREQRRTEYDVVKTLPWKRRTPHTVTSQKFRPQFQVTSAYSRNNNTYLKQSKCLIADIFCVFKIKCHN